MSEESTYEKVTRCPKCSEPGNVRKRESAPRGARLPHGTQIHTVYCENKLCKWYNTCWMVQVNPDGTVPEAKDHTHEPKVYSGFENDDEMAREVLKLLEAQQQAMTEPGAEIRNPYR